MAEYLPFQGRNSIQEAQISVLFLGPFDQRSIEEARGLARADLSGELPQAAEARGGAFRIDITDPTALTLYEPLQSDLMGFRLFRVWENGTPAQVLQLADNILSVSIMDYESWETAIEYAIKYLRVVLISLPLEQNPVVAFSLRFVDRYTYSGDPDDARADKLFAQGNPYITQHTFDAGSVWHCNTGWFDDTARDDRVLHNLNVTSSLIDLSSTVIIDHHATRHLGAPRHSLATVFEPRAGATGLVEALGCLHDRNKSILRQALRPEMLARIGMTK